MAFILQHNDLENWMLALGVCVGATAAMYFLRTIMLRRLGDLSRRTATRIDDLAVRMLRKSFLVFMLAIGVYLGSIFLVMPDSWRLVISRVAVASLLLQLAMGS